MRGILNIRMMSVRAALLAMLVAGLMLSGAQAQSAKQNQKSDKQASRSSQAQPPSAGSKAAEEESAPANKEHAGGPQEGIKIHGHWVIDVRNPDGKLVTHHEFENSFQNSLFLNNILARHNSVGFWEIDLFSQAAEYLITEPNNNQQAISKNLILSTPPYAFVLNGSFTATTAAIITSVSTLVGQCDPNTAPVAPCQTDVGQGFTYTGTSVSIVSGQIVQVTVTITSS